MSSIYSFEKDPEATDLSYERRQDFVKDRSSITEGV